MRCIGAEPVGPFFSGESLSCSHASREWVSSPERPQEMRESNRFFLSNMAAHAANALQRDALCICERRIMLDSRADLSLRVYILAISSSFLKLCLLFKVLNIIYCMS